MQRFLGTIWIELTLYRRGIWLWTTIISLISYLIYGYYLFSKEGLGAGQILQSSTFIVMAAALLGMVAGVITANREREAYLEEVMFALPGDHVRPLAKLAAWFVVVSVMMALSIFSILTIQYFWDSELLSFWWMTVNYILLYWGMTLFVSGIIGYSIQQLIRSFWSYPLLFIIWVAISPYNKILMPKYIADFLNQGEMDPTAAYSDFQGLDLSWESIGKHVFLLLLSIFLLCIALCVEKRGRSKKRGIRFVQTIVVITVIFGLIAIPLTMKDTRYNMDDLFLLYEKDLNDYTQKEKNGATQKTTLPVPTAPSFEVDSYQIQLKHNDKEITYRAEMEVSVPDKGEKGWLFFTLYHGLAVGDVTVNDEPVEWRREGDVLKVKWLKDDIKGKIKLYVRGTTGYKNPIDSSSFYLSSSFPWYPVPGVRNVAEITPDHRLQFKNLELSHPTSFKVLVDEDGEVFSNLPKKGKNQFEGNVRGVTLLFGRLLEAEIDGKHIVAPADYMKKLQKLLPKIEGTSTLIGDRLQREEPSLPEHLFIVPLSTSVNLYPMELTSDQLLLSAEEFRVFYLQPDLAFADPLNVLPAFYWYNRYHEEESLFPFLATALYDHLYGNRTPSELQLMAQVEAPLYGDKGKNLQELAQKMMTLSEKGKTEELKKLLIEWSGKVHKGKEEIQEIKQLLSALQD
ncbi:membrane hypothetical protein [[Clostridium] ultunense Esp]|nr:membrane hypothetical protein [[Clostridium] ultunense Esp]